MLSSCSQAMPCPPHVKLHPFTAELRNVALCPYRQSIWPTWAQKNIILLHSSSLIHSFLIWIDKNPKIICKRIFSWAWNQISSSQNIPCCDNSKPAPTKIYQFFVTTKYSKIATPKSNQRKMKYVITSSHTIHQPTTKIHPHHSP